MRMEPKLLGSSEVKGTISKESITIHSETNEKTKSKDDELKAKEFIKVSVSTSKLLDAARPSSPKTKKSETGSTRELKDVSASPSSPKLKDAPMQKRDSIKQINSPDLASSPLSKRKESIKPKEETVPNTSKRESIKPKDDTVVSTSSLKRESIKPKDDTGVALMGKRESIKPKDDQALSSSRRELIKPKDDQGALSESKKDLRNDKGVKSSVESVRTEIKGKASPGQLRKNFAQHRPGSFNKGSNNVVDEKSLQISTSSIKTSSPPPLQQHFLSPNQSSTDGNTTVHANVLDLGQFFKSHVLFASASNEFIADFTKKMHLRHFLPGDSIIRENEIGRAMFFVIKGVVTVASKDGESIYADLGAGKFFGEIGVLFDIPRTANVVAKTKCFLAVLMSKELQDTMHNYPEIGNEILLEAEHRYSSTFVKKKNADDPEEETNILSISLSKVPEYQHCTDECMHLLAQKLQPKTYSEHSSLYRSGSTGNTMFVMKSGSAQMFGENGEKYATFTSGMFFGETSPLMKVTRNFSVTITSESLIYELNLETIALINEKFPVMKERLDRTSHRSFFLWRIYELRKNSLRTRRFASFSMQSMDFGGMIGLTSNIPRGSQVALNDRAPSIDQLHKPPDGAQKQSHGPEIHHHNERRANFAVRTPFVASRAPIVAKIEHHKEHGIKENKSANDSKAQKDKEQKVPNSNPTHSPEKDVSSVIGTPFSPKSPGKSEANLKLLHADINNDTETHSLSPGAIHTQNFGHTPGSMASSNFYAQSAAPTVTSAYQPPGITTAFVNQSSITFSPITSPEPRANSSTNSKNASSDSVHAQSVTPTILSLQTSGIINQNSNFSSITSPDARDNNTSSESLTSSKDIQCSPTMSNMSNGNEILDSQKQIKEQVDESTASKLSSKNLIPDQIVSPTAGESIEDSEEEEEEEITEEEAAVIAKEIDSKVVNIREQKANPHIANLAQKRRASVAVWSDSKLQAIANQKNDQVSTVKVPGRFAESKAESSESMSASSLSSLDSEPPDDPDMLKEYREKLYLRCAEKAKIKSPLEDSKLLSNIMKYLPFKQAWKFRRVNKFFNKTIDNTESFYQKIDLFDTFKTITIDSISAITKVAGDHLLTLVLKNCFKANNFALKIIAANCRNLEVLDLGGCWDITDEGLVAISLGCRFLRSIDLSNCRKITDSGIYSLVTGCTNFTDIYLSYCKQITDNFLVYISNFCPNIRRINLQRCSAIGDGGYAALAQTKHFKLTELNLSDCSFLTDSAIRDLSACCPALRILNISFCCALTDEAMEFLTVGCPNLITLDASFCGNLICDDTVALLARNCKRIFAISVRGCTRMTDDGIDALIQHSKSIRVLNLTNCKFITPAGLKKVPSTWKLLGAQNPLIEPSGITGDIFGSAHIRRFTS